MSKKDYPMIDIMRIISSILVIGIHTYPFLSLPYLDLFFTHILGRVAVPFFFMTTSFFLFKDGIPSFQKLKSCLVQFLIIYGVSIILYLPIQIYNHSLPTSILEIIKAFLMDGTFYHLWYLPASIIGLSLIYILLKYCQFKTSFIIVVCLYIIGLGGDSYYGLLSQVPLLKQFYAFLFIFCDYTRNGLFFAPLFLWLGALISQHPLSIRRSRFMLISSVSLIVMSIESFLLLWFDIPKHDAMLITLPLLMTSFFYILISYHGQRHPLCKDLSLYIYILHPLVIILVRGFARVLHLENLLILNNLIHFIVVTLITGLLSYLVIHIKKGIHYGYQSIKKRTQLD